MTEDNALKLALKARAARNHALDALAADPIAVIGLGCRLPGDVRSPEDFWALLRDGRDVVASVPADRWTRKGTCRSMPKNSQRTRWRRDRGVG